MNSCGRWINGKCFADVKSECWEGCPFYDDNFDVKKATFDMMKYSYIKAKDISRASKDFNSLVKRLGKDAKKILGTTDWVDYKERNLMGKGYRKVETSVTRAKVEKIKELRKAGLSLSKISVEVEVAHSTLKAKLAELGMR